MDYKKINESTKYLMGIRNNYTPVYTETNEDDELFEVYDIGLDDGVFVKLEIVEDSYGENQHVFGFEFVQAVKKEVVVYEYKKQ